jgi:hypothetical protein
MESLEFIGHPLFYANFRRLRGNRDRQGTGNSFSASRLELIPSSNTRRASVLAACSLYS